MMKREAHHHKLAVEGYGLPAAQITMTPADYWEQKKGFLADGGWGYLGHEIYKPLGWLLGEFAKARSWNGNFLPNVCPDKHGQLPEGFYKRLSALEAWMEEGAEAVFDVTPGPWPERANVPVTIRKKCWYAFADFLHDGPVIIKGVEKPVSVSLLHGGRSLPFVFENGTLSVEIPPPLRTILGGVIRIAF